MEQVGQGQNVEMPRAILEKLDILARRPVAEMHEYELEWLLADLQGLVEMGKTFQRVREGLYILRRDRAMREVVAGAVPIEKTIKVHPLPGQALDFQQEMSN